MRQYKFAGDEIIYDNRGNLSLDKDPKQVWADNHPEFFPVSLNSAYKSELLRVPGLGPTTVRKIIKYRQIHRLGSLADIGIKGVQLAKASVYIKQ